MILPAGTSERFALTLLFACFGPSDSMEHLPSWRRIVAIGALSYDHAALS